MKKIIVSGVACLTLLASVSCSDLLNQAPQGQWTIDDVEGGGYTSEVMALYSQIRGYNITSGIPAFAVHMFRSEDSCKGSTAMDGPEQEAMYDNFNYDASNGLISSYWTENYSIINNTNTILAELEEQRRVSGALTDAEQSLVYECKFFRAYCYFNLVRAFGEVPKVDFAITNSDEANIAKSSVADIYALIDSDLTAAEGLPRTWEKKYIGRATWGAARALHARTYMQRNNWSAMYAAANDVITSKLYDINTPFDKIFRESGENCSESVFELQCTATTAIPADNSIGAQFSQVQGCRGSGSSDLGWGWHMSTAALTSAFETGDPRKDETLLYFTRPGETWEDMVTSAGFPVNGNAPYDEKLSGQDCYGAYFNKKAYSDPSIRESIGSRYGHWVNIRIIRYSDVLLMAAEAACELNDTDTALARLEDVRNRARGTNSAVLPKVTTTEKTALRAAIHHERRVELALEPDRFYDLVRWGEAPAVLGSLGYQAKHQYLPLPQSQVDASNGVLVQNPDYAK